MPDQLFFFSPLGAISITGDDKFIYSVSFLDEDPFEKETANALLIHARSQLSAYFAGERRQFELPLKFSGSDFQHRVWAELQQIPFGQTINYQQLANHLGDPACIRAAASANGKNPFAIVIPCHRVIGSDGKMVGYAGGLWRKQWLLEHEQKMTGKYNKLF